MGRRSRAKDPGSGSQSGPVSSSKPNQSAWIAALRLAGGNAKRLKVNKDGSITVNNKNVR